VKLAQIAPGLEPMSHLFQQRCFNHALREAAAQCPGCGRFFCRECITEHEAKLLCAECVRRRTQRTAQRRSWWVACRRAWAALGGVVVAWLFFYLLGQVLLAVPSAYHEGTIWHEHWLGL